MIIPDKVKIGGIHAIAKQDVKESHESKDCCNVTISTNRFEVFGMRNNEQKIDKPAQHRAKSVDGSLRG